MEEYNNFILPVDDFENAKDFYKNTLGLSIKFDFSERGLCAFKVGKEEPAIILKDKKVFPDSKTSIWFVVNNVNNKYDELNKKGVRFLSKPYKIPTGNAVEFEDLSGNRFGITDYNKE